LDGLAAHTGSTWREISYLFTARSLGYLIGSLLSGRLYDRLSGHLLMATGPIIMAMMMALTPVIPLLWLLIIVLIILGAAEGGLDVGGNTMLVWVHRDKVEPYMNALHFFFGVGAFISPIIIAWAVNRSGDIYWAYWSLALLMFPISLLLLRLPSPAPLKAPTEETTDQVNTIVVGLIVIFFFLYVGAEVAFGGWVYAYAVNLNLTTATMARLLTSAFWGALTVGRLAAIPLAIRIRPRTILLTGLMGCIASVSIILLWQNSLVAMWIGTLGLGFSMASIFPTTLNLAERRMTITGKVMSWFFVGASTGAMFLPWLIGQFFEAVGPSMVMLTILIDLLLALGLFFILISYSARTATTSEATA
jgi:fucose permease